MNIQKDNLTKNYFREWGKHFFSSTNEIYCVYTNSIFIFCFTLIALTLEENFKINCSH